MKRIFAIFCVLVCLFVLAAPAMAASDTITITVQVPKEWTSVHLYAWIDDTHNLVAWPGTPMTKCSDGRYKLEIPAGYPYVIINNGLGSGQTLDLFIGGTSDMWIVMETAEGTAIMHYTDPGVFNFGSNVLTSMALVGEGNGALTWDPADANCEMQLIKSGVYSKNLTMSKGETILFKFCGNDHWDAGYNFGGYDPTDTFTPAVLSGGVKAELSTGYSSVNLSYTATQDCTLTVKLDMSGSVPYAIVEENAIVEDTVEDVVEEKDNSWLIWVILLAIALVVVIVIGVVVVLVVVKRKNT